MILRSNWNGGSGQARNLDVTATAKFLYIANCGWTTTVDTDSAKDQKVLSLAATTKFVVGDTVTIGRDTAREEEMVIASIDAGNDITGTTNLLFAHTLAQADVVEGGSLNQKPMVVWWDDDNSVIATDEMGAINEDDDVDFTPGSSNTGGVLSDGTFHVAWRKVNPDRNTWDGLTEIKTKTISGGTATQKITAPSVAQDTVFSKIELYRSIEAAPGVAAGDLYLEGTLDISGGAQTPEWGLKGDGFLQRQDLYHFKLDQVKFPPETDRIVNYETVTVMKKKVEQTQDSLADIQWSPSRTNAPETFPTSNVFRIQSNEGFVDSWITGANYLFGITPSTVIRINKSGTRLAISKNIIGAGAVSRFGAVAIGDTLVFISPRGMFLLDGNSGKATGIGAVNRVILKDWHNDITADADGATDPPNIHLSVDHDLGCVFAVNNVRQECIVWWLNNGRVTMLEYFPFTLSTTGPHPVNGGNSRAWFYAPKPSVSISGGPALAQLDRIWSANTELSSTTSQTMFGYAKGTAADLTLNSTATGGTTTTLIDTAAQFGPDMVGTSTHIWQGGSTGTRVKRPITSFGTENISDDFDRSDNNSLGPNWTETESSAVAFGTAQTIDESWTPTGRPASVATLTTNKIIVVQNDGGVNKDNAIVGTISGTTITWGDGFEIPEPQSNPTPNAEPRMVAIDSTHMLLVKVDYDTGDYEPHARVLTISGTDITFGPREQIGTSTTTKIWNLIKLSSTVYIVSINNNVGNGRLCVLTVSGNSVTSGPLISNPDDFSLHDLAAMSATTFVAWRGQDSNNKQSACVCTVSGSDITYGPFYIPNTATEPLIGFGGGAELAKVANGVFVVAAHDANDNSAGVAWVGSVSGTVITWGDVQPYFEPGMGQSNIELIAFGTLPSTVLCVLYATNDGQLSANYGTRDGLTIRWDSIYKITDYNSFNLVVRTEIDTLKGVLTHKKDDSVWYAQVFTLTAGTGSPILITLDANRAKFEHNGDATDGHSIAMYKTAPSSADYEVSAKFQRAGNQSQFWVQLFARKVAADEDNDANGEAYVLTFAAQAGTFDGLTVAANNSLVISHRNPPGAHTVISEVVAPVNFNADQQYRLRLRVEGTTLTAWIDDTFVMQVTDSNISAAGFTAMAAASDAASEDHVLVNDFLVTTDITTIGIGTSPALSTAVASGDFYSISCIPFDTIGPMTDRRGGADDLFITRTVKTMNALIHDWDESASTVNSRMRFSTYVEGSTTESTGAYVTLTETPWDMYADVTTRGLVVQPGWSTHGSDEQFELVAGQVGYRSSQTARAGT